MQQGLCQVSAANISITSDLRALANEVSRRRAVAKGEVWLSVHIAAIQRQWL